jgi:protein-disulfide isomerase
LVEKYPGQVKVVFKNFPLRNHKMARPAAQAALAAHMQGQFWAYHDKVFANFSSLNEPKLAQFAAEVGLDLVKFNRDRTSPRVTKQISDDLRLGQVAGVRGTPTVFINGMLLKERSLGGASLVVDAELKRLSGK